MRCFEVGVRNQVRVTDRDTARDRNAVQGKAHSMSAAWTVERESGWGICEILRLTPTPFPLRHLLSFTEATCNELLERAHGLTFIGAHGLDHDRRALGCCQHHDAHDAFRVNPPPVA